MRYQEEDGQAILIVALAMSIFLIGAVGLAVDGSNLYSQRQLAQTAADAGAQAGILSIFDGTNVTGTAGFTTTGPFTCATTDTKTPCVYASKNGFGGSAADTVTVSFPSDSAAPGVTFSSTYPTHLIQVTTSRIVNTTLMQLLGPSATRVTAIAMAAVVDLTSPVPILVTHPTLTGSFSMNGGINVQICGGPSKSIQVNSGASAAASVAGTSGTIDLSRAGPPDDGKCTTGNGADFGIWGGPNSAPFTYLTGTKPGKYVQPASPIEDPLRNVSPPSPIPSVAGTQTTLSAGTGICPLSTGPHGCTVLTPGFYGPTTNTLALTNTTVLVKPGIYYIEGGGFSCTANCNMQMVTGTADTITNTGWDGTAAGGGMLVYNTGTISTVTGRNGRSTTTSTYGPLNLGANGSLDLVGAPPGSAYLGILFFQDRASPALSHTLGGGGGMNLTGTIYLTNPRSTMLNDPTQYQALSLQGTPGSSTHINGEIIAGTLSLGGNAQITMDLNSTVTYNISQVAMVN